VQNCIKLKFSALLLGNPELTALLYSNRMETRLIQSWSLPSAAERVKTKDAEAQSKKVQLPRQKSTALDGSTYKNDLKKFI